MAVDRASWLVIRPRAAGLKRRYLSRKMASLASSSSWSASTNVTCLLRRRPGCDPRGGPGYRTLAARGQLPTRSDSPSLRVTAGLGFQLSQSATMRSQGR
jgi:hypothetical protein